MTDLIQILTASLSTSDYELTLRRIPGTETIRVTTVKHLSGSHSENEIARHNKNCRITNIYRDGHKAGMQLVTNIEVPFCILERSGDNTGHPLTGHSVAPEPLNDST